jgi:cytoskeletal protein CcmA (bactofilin family)
MINSTLDSNKNVEIAAKELSDLSGQFKLEGSIDGKVGFKFINNGTFKIAGKIRLKPDAILTKKILTAKEKSALEVSDGLL